MFAVSRGELLLVAFIFALVWGAGVLPRLGERLGARLGPRGDGTGTNATRGRGPRGGA